MALIGASNSLGGLAGSNAIARLLVVISGDSSQLTSALAQSEGKLKGFASNAGAIGSALTRTVTLPFLAIGGAAVKMAVDFNASLTRVAALTPILDQSGQSFDQLHDKILELANDPEIVASPTELADALYFAGSAGLDAAQAFDVVTLSAKAQSVGMGEAADISKVLIFAMNNYESEALTAAQAMDALTVAIREGTAEPEDLAVALGRLLPVAQQAGVSFQEVTASVAALTNLGVPARVATTSLRALFSQLLAPTIAATKQLDALGITADQLRYKLQQGPIEAFELLTDATKGNFDQTRAIIPQIRGLTAYYGLSGDALEEYHSIIDKTVNSQGALQRVVDQFVQTPTFKFQKAMQQLQLAAISLGDALIPVFVKILDVVTTAARGFAALPGPVKNVAAALLVLGAAVGPLLKLYSVIAAFGTGGVASVKAFTVGVTTMGIGIATALGGISSLMQGSQSIISVIEVLAGSFITLQIAISGVSRAAAAGKIGYSLFSAALGSLSGGQITAIAAGVALLVTGIAYLATESKRSAANLTQMREALIDGAKGGQSFGEAIENIKTEELRNQLHDLAASLNLLNMPTPQALEQLVPRISGDVVSNFERLNSAIQGSGQDLGKAGPVIERVNTALQAAAASGIDTTDAFLAAGGAGGDLGDALDFLAEQASTDPNAGIQGLAGDTKTLTADLIAARDATNAYNDSQLAAIQGAVMGQDGVQNLADQYGVSTDFITQKLNEFGVSSVFTSDKTQQAWAEAAFGVDKNGQLIDASASETSQAVADAMKTMTDAVTGAFNIFEKIPKASAKSFDVYLQRIQDVNEAQSQLVGDMATLAQRGVGSDLAGAILENLGPEGVHRFATASDKELKRYVRAFQVNLALGDEAVLKEGVHLQGKAKENIDGFVASTLKQGKKLGPAGQTLINYMNTAFTNGTLQPGAYSLMKSFVDGLDNAKGLTKQEAGDVSLAFARELTDKHNFRKNGELMMGQVAQGVAQATGVPINEVKQVMSGMIQAMKNTHQAAEREGTQVAQGIARGVKEHANEVRSAGASLMGALANGINLATPKAVRAAHQAAVAVKNQLNESLHGSPKYASFYMGREFAKQFDEGMMGYNHDVRIKDLGRTGSTRHRVPHRNERQKISVNVSRRRVVDEIQKDYDYRG
jgi:TP901 family phage tail tape measure protein